MELARERRGGGGDRRYGGGGGGGGGRRSPGRYGGGGGGGGGRYGGGRDRRRGNPPGRKTNYRLIVENLSSRTSWQVIQLQIHFCYEVPNCSIIFSTASVQCHLI